MTLRVGIVNDFDVVVAGIAGLLAEFEGVSVHGYATGLPAPGEVDAVLFDPFGRPDAEGRLRHIVRATRTHVLLYSWAHDDRVVDAAMRAGASGFLGKSSSGQDVVDALLEVRRGGTVRPPIEPGAADMEAWPGQSEGLTSREAQVLALIATGLSNNDIADQCYLSINSIKTYIRTAYKKMGVTSRSQAVLWALSHGFRPSPD